MSIVTGNGLNWKIPTLDEKKRVYANNRLF